MGAGNNSSKIGNTVGGGQGRLAASTESGLDDMQVLRVSNAYIHNNQQLPQVVGLIPSPMSEFMHAAEFNLPPRNQKP